jgi:hypothetical protein
MSEKLGKAAVRFAATYLRRRYRREIRLGVAAGVVAVGVAIYLANRHVPEG